MINILGLDFETTGPVPSIDYPVSGALLQKKYDGEQSTDILPLINSLCNPGMSIPAGAIDIHGITNDHVKWAISYQYLVYSIYQHIYENGPVVLTGYNITTYDIPILLKIYVELGLVDKSFCPYRGSLSSVHKQVQVFDLYAYALRHWYEYPSLKLTDLVTSRLNYSPEGAHDAAYDVVSVFSLIDSIDNLSEAIEEMQTPKPYEIMPLGKHKGKRPEDIPSSYFRYLKTVMLPSDPVKPDFLATINKYA